MLIQPVNDSGYIENKDDLSIATNRGSTNPFYVSKEFAKGFDHYLLLAYDRVD